MPCHTLCWRACLQHPQRQISRHALKMTRNLCRRLCQMIHLQLTDAGSAATNLNEILLKPSADRQINKSNQPSCSKAAGFWHTRNSPLILRMICQKEGGMLAFDLCSTLRPLGANNQSRLVKASVFLAVYSPHLPGFCLSTCVTSCGNPMNPLISGMPDCCSTGRE